MNILGTRNDAVDELKLGLEREILPGKLTAAVLLLLLSLVVGISAQDKSSTSKTAQVSELGKTLTGSGDAGQRAIALVLIGGKRQVEPTPEMFKIILTVLISELSLIA